MADNSPPRNVKDLIARFRQSKERIDRHHKEMKRVAEIARQDVTSGAARGGAVK